MAASEPTEKDLKEHIEMSDSCFAMIKEMLEGLGIQMDACPPMFYPEAIKNLYVWTAWASRDCERAHKWHEGDPAASANCIHEAIKKFGKDQQARERVGRKKT